MRLGQKILMLVIFSLLVCGICFATDTDKNQIVLNHTSNNVVQVSIKLKKDASVASFQIGLKIDGYSDEVDFDWSDNLFDNKLYDELSYSYDLKTGILNLYYVGTEELNDAKLGNKIDVGTIKFDNTRKHSLTISPIDESTVISSIGHKEVEVNIDSNDDKISFNIEAKDDGYTIQRPEEELEVEDYMKENKALDSLAISLRCSTDMINPNIYALGDKVTYYIDYKNGGKDINDKVEIKLELPLDFKVTKYDQATVSKTKKTLTWTLDGLKADEAGTKEVRLEYKDLKGSKDSSKEIITATISVKGSKKDESSVINLIVKDIDKETDEIHEPYMRGDSTGTFRPDDTMTRGEAAIVLTRIFGINTNFNDDALAFPDLANTYPEARNAVRAAVQNGLVTGYPDGTYKPDNPMTVAELIAIIARQVEVEYGDGFEIKDLEDLISIYKDRGNTGYLASEEHWGVIYATLLARLNMTPLTSKNNDLKLDNYITRAEAVQLVNYYLFRAPAKSSLITSSKFSDVPYNHKLLGDILEATRESHNLSLSENGYEK